jgi:pSer/pThr/pTyr-binding forkhead associated (FHA) protein
MDLFEKFNNKFGTWYESLFGGEDNELRPRDVLRKIIAAMEDNRKPGLDSRVYVPNKYTLELSVEDQAERDYLLAFLDEAELMTALQRFMAQHNYFARGPLDFSIDVTPQIEGGAKREKLRVIARFEKGIIPEPPIPVSIDTAVAMPEIADFDLEEDDSTVPSIPWAALTVIDADGHIQEYTLTRRNTKIGRSRSAGNDLVLNDDGMVSKTHASIELERDGLFTLYDLGSMNGVLVNGVQIQGNRVLKERDEIVIGGTKIIFHQARLEPPVDFPTANVVGGGTNGMPSVSSVTGLPRRGRLLELNGDEHVLGSETLIGSSPTADIVIADPSVSTKHAKITSPDSGTYYIEDLASEYGTYVNSKPLVARQRSVLATGDAIIFGAKAYKFVGAAK